MTQNDNPADGNNPNPQDPSNDQGGHAENPVDYKVKFGASTAENQRITAENAEKDRLLAEKEAEIERLKNPNGNSGPSNGSIPQDLYPGFENLDEDAQKSVLAFTDGIKKKVTDDIHQDPALKFARESYNEQKWNSAYEKVADKYPDIKPEKGEFKGKYFKASNVPDNIESILEDLAKIHLFDKAKDIGANEAREQADRIDIERANGGDKTPTAGRTMEDWNRMAQENPVEFAKKAGEFQADLASGKLK